MLAVALTVLTILLAATGGAAVGLWLRASRVALRRRVVVNLVDDRAVQGVLWSRAGRLLILRDAVLLERGAEPASVDGEVLIERDRVDFVQVL